MNINYLSNLKRILSVIISLVIILSAFAVLPASAAETDIADTGDFEWSITDYKLTITGSGDMDYSYFFPPWYSNYKRSDITEVEICSGITNIGNYAFSDFFQLRKVTIPDTVTRIGEGAFDDCSKLAEIKIPDSVTSIGAGAFSGCGSLCSITIPNGVTTIEYKMFKNCGALTSVTLPDSVTSIDGNAFDGCGSLPSVSIPAGVTSLGSSVFYNCAKLTEIKIPDTVTSIGGNAFDGCEALTSLNIPAGVTYLGGQLLCHCPNLSSLTVSEGNSVYDSRGNCNAVIETSSNTLVCGCTATVIPDTVREIKDEAFKYSYCPSEIIFPDSVTKIGDEAFYISYGLKKVVIPSSVITVGEDAFTATGINTAYVDAYELKKNAFDNALLTELTLGDNVTIIGSYAFYSDYATLKSVTVPPSVTSIGYRALGYYKHSKLNFVTQIDGFTITGYDDTAAQSYAKNNELTFISLGAVPEPDKLGDADGSGEVDAADATVVQRAVTKIAVPYDEAQLMNADVDSDGSLTIVDATFIQRYSTKVTTPYKIGEAIE